MNTEELLTVEMTPELLFEHAAGRYGSVFLKALKQDAVLLASKCHACGIVQVPPRIICGACWKETRQLVPVGPQGSLLSYTMVTFPFIDPFTGVTREVPYCYGMIQLDGADNSFQHFLAESDIEKLSYGMRVEAVFAENRVGSLSDIKCFKAAGQTYVEERSEELTGDEPLAGQYSVKRFFELFNETIPNKEFAPLLELFTEDAELTVKLLGKKHFKGRAQIAQAFGGLPKKSSMTLLEERCQDNSVTGRFELRGLPIKIKGKLTANFNAAGKIESALLTT